MTELRVSDGQMNLRDSVVSVSFAPGTSGETVLQDVARRMGLAVQLGEDVTFAAYPNGYSYVGYGRNALTEICDASGLTWSVQNGILQVILAGGTTGVRGLVFGPESGLVDYPQRIIRANASEDAKTTKRTRKQKAGKEKQRSRPDGPLQRCSHRLLFPGIS